MLDRRSGHFRSGSKSAQTSLARRRRDIRDLRLSTLVMLYFHSLKKYFILIIEILSSISIFFVPIILYISYSIPITLYFIHPSPIVISSLLTSFHRSYHLWGQRQVWRRTGSPLFLADGLWCAILPRPFPYPVTAYFTLKTYCRSGYRLSDSLI
jgi:hypothetical protein